MLVAVTIKKWMNWSSKILSIPTFIEVNNEGMSMQGITVYHGQNRFGQEKHFLKVIKEQGSVWCLHILPHLKQFQNTYKK